MQPDRLHDSVCIGIDIDDDPAAAQRRAQRSAARILQQREIGGRHRQRQYIAIVERRAHRASPAPCAVDSASRSEEHTSELQSLMRRSYADIRLKKNTLSTTQHT